MEALKPAKPVKPDPDDLEQAEQVVGKLEKVQRKSSGGDGIFAAGRFHDLGLAPALGDHIHGARLILSCCCGVTPFLFLLDTLHYPSNVSWSFLS